MYPFASPMMMGASVLGATTTLDKAFKGSGLVLSNNDLTATNANGPASTNQLTRSTSAKSNGKKYFEFKVVNPSTFDIAVGILSGSPSTNSWLSTVGIAVNDGGTIWKLNADTGKASLGQFTASDIGRCAIDLDGGLVWFARNNTWSGDPVAGSGGVSFTPGAWYAAGSIYNPNEAFTMNFGGSAFALAPPSGFNAWG